MTGSKSKTPDRLVAKIMKYQCTDKPLHFDDPRQHGIQLELVALGAFIEYKEERDAPVSVDECGLFVSIDHPFLATSTDGIVTDASADGNGALEIKCPVGGRTIAELSVIRKNFCLKKDAAGCLSLRRSHPYFTQVQFEQAVTGYKWADFVVFSLFENDEYDNVCAACAVLFGFLGEVLASCFAKIY